MRYLILVLTLFVYTPCSLANVFVGNGGDGVEIDGQLYLRDLFSIGKHQAPDFGSEIDAHLPTLPGPDLISFPYPKELLARKLTDLNLASSGMGDYILGAMKVYTWVLIEVPLAPIDANDDAVSLPVGASFVQIANRSQTLVRINSESWARLDDANKVALLIHEAVYSLVRPNHSAGGVRQSAYVAREITGSFFNKEYLSKNSSLIHESWSAGLSIPRHSLTLSEVRSRPVWKLQYSLDRNRIRELTPDWKQNQNYDTLAALSVKACTQLERNMKRRPSESSWLQSTVTRRAVSREVRSYYPDRLQPDLQTYVTFEENGASPTSDEIDFESLEQCKNEMHGTLLKISSDLW